MDDIYREIILDHYKNPRNFGEISRPTCSCHLYNSACGDDITIDLVVSSQGSGVKQIREIKFRGNGCAISTASASLLTEKVSGRNIEDIKKMKTDDMLNMLGMSLTPSRLKCALLPLEALQKAIGSKRL